jgi:hypothetical protein
MSSSHVVLELGWAWCHVLITCNSAACNTYTMPLLHAFFEHKLYIYSMPSVSNLHCYMLLWISSCYFLSWCTRSLIGHTVPIYLGPWAIYCALITCGSGAWASICHGLATCSSVAFEAYAMLSLHAVSELATHRVCCHCMQFQSLQAYAMPP